MSATQDDPSRKRRNRWGDASDEAPASVPSSDPVKTTTETNTTSEEGETKRPRRSRFGAIPDQTAQVAPPSTAPVDNASMIAAARGRVAALAQSIIGTSATFSDRVEQPKNTGPISEVDQQRIVVLNLQLQKVTQSISTVVQDAKVKEADPNRSPSPPPRYDSNGMRTNTREMRMREALMSERSSLIEQLIKLNPAYVPPSDYVRSRPMRRIFFPKDHTQYNYIGLILGPRGNTQRSMEQETGCRISIRGRGSVKDGSRGRQFKTSEDEMDLHVYLHADSEDKVEAASKLVHKLLTRVEDEFNDHKQKQLRELAVINGTLREDNYCLACGEKGHMQYDCPYRGSRRGGPNAGGVSVRCSICGDHSHPTRDCPNAKNGSGDATLDAEYSSFMAELGGKGSSNDKSSNDGGPVELAPVDMASMSNKPGAPRQERVTPTFLAPVVDLFANPLAPSAPKPPASTSYGYAPSMRVPPPPPQPPATTYVPPGSRAPYVAQQAPMPPAPVPQAPAPQPTAPQPAAPIVTPARGHASVEAALQAAYSDPNFVPYTTAYLNQGYPPPTAAYLAAAAVGYLVMTTADSTY